jgi:hypothetical protein
MTTSTERSIPGTSVLDFDTEPVGRKRRHSGESENELACKKIKNDPSPLRKTIETLQEIISCQQHLIVQKYEPFATQEGFVCRVSSCGKPFGRADTLKRHICNTDDPTHKSLATVMDQTHCIKCHDTTAAPRNLNRHERDDHNTSGLRLDRILGGEAWTCRDTCKCVVTACWFVLQRSQILMLSILHSNSTHASF